VLINKARAHEKAGDHKRVASTRTRSCSGPIDGKLNELFKKEIEEVKGRVRAINEARKLAEAGRQVEAHELLKKFLDDADAWLLPWKIETVPPGARVKLDDGSERSTPLTLETTWTPGRQPAPRARRPRAVRAQGRAPGRPADRAVAHPRARLGRHAPRRGAAVAVGDDHVVVDRAAASRAVAQGPDRVGRQAQLAGRRRRAPVFLQGRAGSLLVVTEDGEVWIVNAADGAMEGPWASGSQPIAGPTAALDGVRVSSRTARPTSGPRASSPTRPGRGRAPPRRSKAATADKARARAWPCCAGARARRRRSPARGRRTRSRSARTLHAQHEALPERARQVITNVHRKGEWTYVAWEAPNVSIPHGRLWISDARACARSRPDVERGLTLG
jgi:hypothetical protein